mgnify:CR=1 FL=1
MRAIRPNSSSISARARLEDVLPEQLSITAVLPTRQHVPYRVRVFIEHLEKVLNNTHSESDAFLRKQPVTNPGAT